MAGTAEFSYASSAGVNCKAAAPVFSSICAIRDDEIRTEVAQPTRFEREASWSPQAAAGCQQPASAASLP
jgi:hypothetical protein